MPKMVFVESWKDKGGFTWILKGKLKNKTLMQLIGHLVTEPKNLC